MGTVTYLPNLKGSFVDKERGKRGVELILSAGFDYLLKHHLKLFKRSRKKSCDVWGCFILMLITEEAKKRVSEKMTKEEVDRILKSILKPKAKRKKKGLRLIKAA